MRHWYKLLGSFLLLYVGIFSLYYPLKPALVETDATQLKPGYNRIVYRGFYTNYDENSQAGISFGEAYIPGDIQFISDHELAVTFELPDTLNSTTVAFRTNSPNDGGLVLMNQALSLDGFEIIPGYQSASFQSKPTWEIKETFAYPNLPRLHESVRNLCWHVPMWFTMFFVMIFSFIQSLKVLNAKPGLDQVERMIRFDLRSTMLNEIGWVFCVLGLLSGSLWARFTWGDWWTDDPQLNGALVVFLVYSAFFVMRPSIEDEIKRAKISAVYNVFAFVLMMLLLMVLPRFTEGLHPGKGGNPAFSQYDLDSTLRTVFYPAVIGWICIAFWMYRLRLRTKRIKEYFSITED
jgi:heme exporter protein C